MGGSRPLAAASRRRSLVGGLLSILVGSALILPAAPPTLAATPTFAQLIGQKLIVAMSGTIPDSDLLGLIGRGEVGGVILFGSNITSASQLAGLTAKLRNAATAGGQ